MPEVTTLLALSSSGDVRHLRILTHAAQELSLLPEQLTVVDAAIVQTVAGCQVGDDVCQRRVVSMTPAREQVVSQMKVQPAHGMVQPAWRGLPVAGCREVMSIPAVWHQRAV